jgi:4'-phosphopantetheinyl transferase
MIDVLIFNVEGWNESEAKVLLESLPERLGSEITRYKAFKDQKLRLAARLMIQRYLQVNAYPVGLEGWERGEENKPFIKGGPSFNISHSGNLVVVSFAKTEVGIDLEEEKQMDMTSMSAYFHPEELEYIGTQSPDLPRFYNLWVRKEAFLKALGTGVMGDLIGKNCLKNTIPDGNKAWSIQNIGVGRGYHCAICSSDAPMEVKITHIEHF